MGHLKLVDCRSREVRETLDELAVLSRTADFRSLAFIIQIGAHDHRLGLAGGYSARPIDAYNAMRLLDQKLRQEILY